MKKILLTVIAGIGGFSALLADGGRPVVITKTDHDSKAFITLGNSVCVADEIWETREFHEAWAKLEPNFYGTHPVRVEKPGDSYDVCSHVANWKEGYVEPDFVSDDERVCTRIEGCEINPKAETEEEYCPTCVWKSEVKKIKTGTNEENLEFI